ncbi:hypothetical protein K469DRAFT_245366 [Zopfia rhizophila CBS 207.26]|uniref:Uncharacterized protein n=1 Tax=Zopfia rhizophila CBS 207.26 TaxID=1314779 RepID=A0A6A6DR90_9PEZI|nr:hypothetical protein K469DRAFT_245366 [Zopfia rhizophila CBS 207.26]
MKFTLLAPALTLALSIPTTNAWQVNLFSDENCQNLVFARGGTGSQGCTSAGNPPANVKSYQYFSDGGLLQLFTAPICSTTLIFQTRFSSAGCTTGLGNGISAFAILP